MFRVTCDKDVVTNCVLGDGPDLQYEWNPWIRRPKLTFV